MVDEPEAMEVVDDDVYHPDLSVRDSGPSSSLRSLEPIIAGPVGLKTIFYDPRWSTRQRKCCVGQFLLTVHARLYKGSLFFFRRNR